MEKFILTHIQEDVCPICGCKDIDEIQIYQKHTNGYFNERLKFKCGYELHFSPNFRKVEINHPCRHDPEHIKSKRKRFDASNRLLNYINRLNVDKEFKNKLLTHIDHLLCKTL